MFQSVRKSGGESLFRAVYTDGDSEDLSYEDLKALVTPGDLKAHLDVVRKHYIRTWMAGQVVGDVFVAFFFAFACLFVYSCLLLHFVVVSINVVI